MKVQTIVQQEALRHETWIGTQICSHSGEFVPWALDVTVPGRGLHFQFVRRYRSALSDVSGPFGRGWTHTYAKRLEQSGDAVLYYDGVGRTYRFEPVPGKRRYLSPPELYAVLTRTGDHFVLSHRYGVRFTFEAPENGGDLLAIEDRNGNTLRFQRGAQGLHVTDPLGRLMIVTYDRNRAAYLEDHAGRVWRYMYNADGCLVEVIQPPTDDSPDGPRLRYDYDALFRLSSITDPRGQTFLRNSYDDQGRIIRQVHGAGETTIEYETIGRAASGAPIYRTRVTQKNGSRLVLEHDPGGHVLRRTLFVTSTSLAPDDREGGAGDSTPLTTLSSYNRHGELVRRVYPAGNGAVWDYSVDAPDPRDQGNLLRYTQTPAPGVESDQDQLVTSYTYEPRFQLRRSVTDPRGHTVRFAYDSRGNLTRKTYPKVTVQTIAANQANKGATKMQQYVETFRYNASGQLVGHTDARGATTEYHYYPERDPIGAAGRLPVEGGATQGGGFLARMVQDPAAPDRRLQGKPAQRVMEYAYDVYSNLATIWDGKSNATRLEYNSHNRLIRTISRSPFDYELQITRDPNGNPAELAVSFDHQQFDDAQGAVVAATSTLRQRREYNQLNNLIDRTFSDGAREITERFTRDASENLIRRIQPLGNVTEYRYDERNLLLETTLGVGSLEQMAVRRTYTRNGGPRSFTNGRGGVLRHDYDGFHRYRGFTNPAGTIRKQWLDAAGNVTRTTVSGDTASVDARDGSVHSQTATLLESRCTYDELNRRVRLDRAWHDPATGQPLGNSRWDGQPGTVSTVAEYAGNHLPVKIWQESGNVLTLEYDGANRIVAASDATGAAVSCNYDANGNLVRLERVNPAEAGLADPFQQIIEQRFDELDRLVARSVNGQLLQAMTYNALGRTTARTNALGRTTARTNALGVRRDSLHDSFGRWVGQAINGLLVYRVDRDDNNRVVARTNPNGHRVQYQFDALDRCTGRTNTDGTQQTYQRDPDGNVMLMTDESGRVFTQRYDQLNRLLERRVSGPAGETLGSELFHYDGLNRLVLAESNGIHLGFRYDSLSRLLAETQPGGVLQYFYNSGGKRMRTVYPSSREILKVYDVLNRVVEVRDQSSALIARYTYRSPEQVAHVQLPGGLEARLSYDPTQLHVGEIEYRAGAGGMPVAGSRYRYDAAGNRLHEIQLHKGAAYGDRYRYDAANRLIAVEYGVEDVDNPTSAFEQAVQYDLGLAGAWKTKTVRAPGGGVISQLGGVTDQREAYVSLGGRRFERGQGGNLIAEVDPSAPIAGRRYTYDYANRPLQLQCMAGDGTLLTTVEYGWDALNRQVRRGVIDAAGRREHVRVWDGWQLAEEWEDGRLLRSFVYGAEPRRPVQMTNHSSEGDEVYSYAGNGRGFVTALLDAAAQPVERYRYDAFGTPSLDGMGGDRSPNHSPSSPSQIANPIFAGAQPLDPDAGVVFHRGSAFDSSTAQFAHGVFSDTSLGGSILNPNGYADDDFWGPLNRPEGAFFGGTSFSKCFAEAEATTTTAGIAGGGPPGAAIGGLVGLILGAFFCADTDKPQTQTVTPEPTPDVPDASVEVPAEEPATGTNQGAAPNQSGAAPNQSIDPGTSSEPNQSIDPTVSPAGNQSINPGTSGGVGVAPANNQSGGQNQSTMPDLSGGTNQSVNPNQANQSTDPGVTSDPNQSTGSDQSTDPNSCDPGHPDDPNQSGGYPNPEGGGPGGPAGMPNPEGGGPGGPAGMPNPEGGGPGGPLSYPNPDGTGPGGPAGIVNMGAQFGLANIFSAGGIGMAP